MKYILTCKDSDGKQWTENYDRNVVDPEKDGRELIDYFNATLRPYEKKRFFVGVEVVSNEKHHDWVKKTAGMSVDFKGRTVDLFFCSSCGITGKRFGLGREGVKRDSKFKSKKFEYCKENYD